MKIKKERDWLGEFMREVGSILISMPEVGGWRVADLTKLIKERDAAIKKSGSKEGK